MQTLYLTSMKAAWWVIIAMLPLAAAPANHPYIHFKPAVVWRKGVRSQTLGTCAGDGLLLKVSRAHVTLHVKLTLFSPFGVTVPLLCG